MRFTIVTPSFNQLDWLGLCIALVADQQGAGFIEHIVQDAGTPGIEEFARRLGADFYRDGKKVGRWEGEGKVNEWEGEKVGMWEGEGKVEEREGMKVGKCDGEKLNSGGYSLTIYSEKDAGMYDAVNRGMRKATGEVCAYLNCDEQYFPGTLRWVADYFLHSTETEVLFGAVIITRADGSYVCDRRVMVPTRWHTMVSGNLSIFTSSTFFRRKSVVERRLLFDPQWRVCGDAVWAFRFLDAGLRMQSTHKPLSAFAETGSNMSAVGNSRAAEESRRLALSVPAAARVAQAGGVAGLSYAPLVERCLSPEAAAVCSLHCRGYPAAEELRCRRARLPLANGEPVRAAGARSVCRRSLGRWTAPTPTAKVLFVANAYTGRCAARRVA